MCIRDRTKTEDSSSKDSQGQEEVSAPEASSLKNQATAGTDGQAGTSGSACLLYTSKLDT